MAEFQIYHGDCLEILPTLDLAEVAIVITDPPYSSGGFQEAGKSGGSIGTRSNDVIDMDNLSTRGYERLISKTLRYCNQADEIYMFTDWRMWVYTFDLIESAGWRIRNMLVWDKKQMGMGMPWRNQHELLVYGKRTPARITGGDRGNVLQFSRTGNSNHPTEKPVALIEALLLNSCNFGTVIDPFMGSGTTGVACIRNGFNFIGVERSLTHFETAQKRLEQAKAQGSKSRHLIPLALDGGDSPALPGFS